LGGNAALHSAVGTIGPGLAAMLHYTALLALQALGWGQCCTTQRCWHYSPGLARCSHSAVGTAGPGLQCCTTQRCWHYRALGWAAMLHYTAAGTTGPGLGGNAAHAAGTTGPGLGMLHYTALP
jgi:hypothetical protein